VAEGTVLWFDSESGAGVIRADGVIVPKRPWWRKRRPVEPEHLDVVVHYAQIQMRGFKDLCPGQRVAFRWFRGPDGVAVAEKVTPLSGPYPPCF